MTYTTCGCTAELASEAATQAHAKVCALLGYPAHPTTCRVTVGLDNSDHRPTRPCGEPAVAGALCARHAADRERLS